MPTLNEQIESIRETHKSDLITNDRYLVIIMETNADGKNFVTESMVFDKQKEVRAFIGVRTNWLVFGKYDFKKNPHIGVLRVLAEDTNTLHLPVNIV